ncbi:hypothetical protein P1P75_11935 [Streptomyces sp. ID05-39B]|uniref:hypothetical protein n=1 Tax=Streptomyces sp. ID05-39B TaxID=3028664 RepID=UPI0029B40113|nr:hypothetical protein [Streptomyces sp. ID05-39B]MDX3527133.1 hypothetical protein [Streptomyces sp. ID05-39B]
MTVQTAPVELAWLACDLRSGRIAEELRSLSGSGPIERKLSVSSSAQFDLNLAKAPADWEAATDPGRTLLVAVDTLTSQPIWSGFILTRSGGTGRTIQLGAATPEAYLDRRYTGTYTGIDRDQALIMGDLVTAATVVEAPPFEVDAPTNSAPIVYQLLDGDDRTVLSALQELTGMDGAPEWTIDTEWADAAQTAIQLVLRVRPKIGVQSDSPESVFDMPGCVASYVLTESYEQGKGATQVRAWGEGEGNARLRSADQTATDLITAGWCRWEHRFTPSTGLTDPDQLDAHAIQGLAQQRTGTKTWTLEATASRAPRLGRDWNLGDSVRLQVATSLRHPGGAEVVSRAYAWQLDTADDKVTPFLVEED